jgi:MerR family transcriptional regulator, copper efflux regulator
MEQRLRIGQLAERCGVSADTIRYYERIGLMPKAARTSAGYREYSESAKDRVRLVQNALRFGFSLKQVGAFLGVRQAGGAPCKHVRAAGAQILEAIEQRIAELMASRESIKETLELWDRRLSQTPEGRPAHLLEALAGSEMPLRGRGRGLRGRE